MTGSNSAELAPAQVGDVARELGDRHLHAETDAEVRHQVLAGVARSADLALDAADPEAAGHQDAVHLGEDLVDLLGRERLGVDPLHVDLVVVEDAGVVERLVHREVRVGQLHVLADQRDVDLVGERCRVRDERVPLGHVGLAALQVQPLDDHLVEPLRREVARHLVDAARVDRRDDRTGVDVAEQADLAADAHVDGAIGAAHDEVGLDTDASAAP